MTDFAKLFQFEEIGQVLVKLDDGDEGPEVRIYFQPENLGVCSTAFNFEEDQKGTEWEKAEKAFEMVDEKTALSVVTELLKVTPKFGGV